MPPILILLLHLIKKITNFATKSVNFREIMTINVTPTKRQGLLALSPIFVFLAFYLGVSIAVGDFYKVPVSVAFILAVTWAVVTTHGINLSKRIEIFSRGAANANVL